MRSQALLRRGVGAAARRLGRPELVSALYSSARQAEHESIGIDVLLAGTLGPGCTYVDVGTNRGQVLKEAVRVAPRAQHIAFEPIPSLAAELAAGFPGVVCRQLALGASSGRAQFCYFTKLDGWSGLRRNPAINDERGRPEFIDVQVSTLDMEMAELTPTVIKIDVEGAELAVLEGGVLTLARARPLLIFEHVPETARAYDGASGRLWDLLTELDYLVFSAAGAGPFTRCAFAEPSSTVNWLASPQAR
jgi:FkbM family methyltransferase